MHLANVLRTTLLTSVGTTLSLLLQGHKQGRPYAPISAVSHILYGDKPMAEPNPNHKYSLAGAAVNTLAMASWAVLYETVVARLRRKSAVGALAAGAAMSAAAYVVDYHVVPPRLTPGFEKVLDRRGMWTVYGVLAATFALAALAGRDE